MYQNLFASGGLSRPIHAVDNPSYYSTKGKGRGKGKSGSSTRVSEAASSSRSLQGDIISWPSEETSPSSSEHRYSSHILNS
jgi:hypothetical protein